MTNVHVMRTGEEEHLLVGTDVTTIKASGRHTAGDLLVLEGTVPPGGGPPSADEMRRMMAVIEKYLEVLPPDQIKGGAKR